MSTERDDRLARRGSPALADVLRHADAMAIPAAVASGVLELVEGQALPPRHVASRAARSPEIAALLLRVCANGRGRPVESLEAAVAELGGGAIATLLTSRSTYRLVGAELGLYGVSRVAFLRHSTDVGAMAARVARLSGDAASARAAGLAGLLVDIAKPVLDDALGATTPGIAASLAQEQELLGADHARVGGWLARRWRLPTAVGAAIEGHHAATPPVDVIGRAVWLAELLVAAGRGEGAAIEIARGAMVRCGVAQECLDELLVGDIADVPDRPPGLTARETQILRMLASGHPAKQVARLLGCSLSTVHNHLHHVYRKLEVSGQAQALLVARENGWV